MFRSAPSLFRAQHARPSPSVEPLGMFCYGDFCADVNKAPRTRRIGSSSGGLTSRPKPLVCFQTNEFPGVRQHEDQHQSWVIWVCQFGCSLKFRVSLTAIPTIRVLHMRTRLLNYNIDVPFATPCPGAFLIASRGDPVSFDS